MIASGESAVASDLGKTYVMSLGVLALVSKYKRHHLHLLHICNSQDKPWPRRGVLRTAGLEAPCLYA
jgi:hypothetical protein